MPDPIDIAAEDAAPAPPGVDPQVYAAERLCFVSGHLPTPGNPCPECVSVVALVGQTLLAVATVRAHTAELAEAAAAVLELLGAGIREARPVKRLRAALAGWGETSVRPVRLEVRPEVASDVGTCAAEVRGTPENLAALARALAPWRCRVAQGVEGCRCIDDLSATLAHAAALIEEEVGKAPEAASNAGEVPSKAGAGEAKTPDASAMS